MKNLGLTPFTFSPDEAMKVPLLFLAPSILAATLITDAHAQGVSQPSPLDHPGTGPIGPTPSGPGGLPLIPQIPPVIIAPPDIGESQSGPFRWMGGSPGTFFDAANWRNAASETPYNFTTGTALNYALSGFHGARFTSSSFA